MTKDIYIKGTDMYVVWELNMITGAFDWLYTMEVEQKLTGKFLEEDDVNHLVGWE